MEPQQPLVCPSHKTHYVLSFTFGALLVGVAAYSFGYQSGFMDAKDRVIQSPGGALYSSPAEVKTFSGVVTAVNPDSITVKMHSSNPFDDPDMLVRTVNVSSTTKLTKRTPGDIQAFMAAQEAFVKKMQANPKTAGTPPMPPEPVVTPVELSTVIVGDTVVVTAAENIASMKSFTASEIEVQ